ncbi:MULTISPECIES: SDR family oxidoreductase [Planktothricoides]|uniref:dTDP-4-dehydrorhamnose reductase n=2 Tax=Planktothricoides raciborskii TaxID=132608 RepID=A0AAU8JGR8_9CYAN|nr:MULTISPECIES: NAD(P)-dependent oxidoreductase [Planktothricoides]KOR34162.1 dTDP-4-dehydrorhamnose reductase [Planktothricoides sp. SR001]MBD2547335.1 NAD(P)-dependent oxidoreductase [Planktothricoides raciborskii FACHB-1370]MBD2585193.1 NAD(P)-dependent oxidoreductase [Planktothricoides raciborskii FACHB-1261]
MKKLLLTGCSGFLGWNICQIAGKKWQVYGTYLAHPLVIPGVNLSQFDLTNYQELKHLFQEVKPDAVIHAAAASQPNFCQNHPQISQEINVTVSANIAGLCADAEIPCVFTSTDLVFDGLNPPYQETDSVCPVSFYGEQKVMAENAMLSRYPLTAICRMPLMFGNGGPVAESFIQPMLAKLQAGEELSLFMDEFRTPVSGKTAAEGLLLAVENQWQGIIHLGGKERISRYDFFRLLVEVRKLESAKLKPCLQKNVQMSAPRPPDVSLDSSKAFGLGYNPPLLKEAIASHI